jgi:hypothetical protein
MAVSREVGVGGVPAVGRYKVIIRSFRPTGGLPAPKQAISLCLAGGRFGGRCGAAGLQSEPILVNAEM